jgi:hypothetical protein
VKTDLAITGSVHTAHDVLKAMMAGAQVVEIASVLLRHGAGFVKALKGDLKQWMEEHVRGAGVCIAPPYFRRSSMVGNECPFRAPEPRDGTPSGCAVSTGPASRSGRAADQRVRSEPSVL